MKTPKMTTTRVGIIDEEVFQDTDLGQGQGPSPLQGAKSVICQIARVKTLKDTHQIIPKRIKEVRNLITNCIVASQKNQRIKLKWATSMLGTKEVVEFDNMSFDQYVFGKTCILNKKSINKKEKETWTYLMKRISKLMPKFGFSTTKELYREVLQVIEKGEFAWDDWYEIQCIEIKFDHVKIDEIDPIRS